MCSVWASTLRLTTTMITAAGAGPRATSPMGAGYRGVPQTEDLRPWSTAANMQRMSTAAAVMKKIVNVPMSDVSGALALLSR